MTETWSRSALYGRNFAKSHDTWAPKLRNRLSAITYAETYRRPDDQRAAKRGSSFNAMRSTPPYSWQPQTGESYEFVDEREVIDTTTHDIYPTIPPSTLRKWKQKSAKRPGYIPRPPNSFVFFRCDFVRQNVGTGGDLSRRAGEAWKRLPSDVKKAYKERAMAAAEEHRQLFPDYIYQRSHVAGSKFPPQQPAVAQVAPPSRPLADSSTTLDTAAAAATATTAHPAVMSPQHLTFEPYNTEQLVRLDDEKCSQDLPALTAPKRSRRPVLLPLEASSSRSSMSESAMSSPLVYTPPPLYTSPVAEPTTPARFCIYNGVGPGGARSPTYDDMKVGAFLKAKGDPRASLPNLFLGASPSHANHEHLMDWHARYDDVRHSPVLPAYFDVVPQPYDQYGFEQGVQPSAIATDIRDAPLPMYCDPQIMSDEATWRPDPFPPFPAWQ